MPFNIPNVLTWLRIVLIPLFVGVFYFEKSWVSLPNQNLVATIIFTLAAVTDWLDGWLARKLNQTSAFGAFLDPVADKLLVITSFIMLGSIGGIPPWLAVVVVARDILILVGYVIVYVLVEERFEVKPSRIGKWSTTFQLLTLAVALTLLHDPKLFSARVLDAFVVLTALTTVLSGSQYLYRGLVWLQNRAPSISRPS